MIATIVTIKRLVGYIILCGKMLRFFIILPDLVLQGKLGVWLYHFLTGGTQFLMLHGGVSFDSPVISGVPQGTVLGPLLFIILMCDINSVITSSSMDLYGQFEFC